MRNPLHVVVLLQRVDQGKHLVGLVVRELHKPLCDIFRSGIVGATNPRVVIVPPIGRWRRQAPAPVYGTSRSGYTATVIDQEGRAAYDPGVKMKVYLETTVEVSGSEVSATHAPEPAPLARGQITR